MILYILIVTTLYNGDVANRVIYISALLFLVRLLFISDIDLYFH